MLRMVLGDFSGSARRFSRGKANNLSPLHDVETFHNQAGCHTTGGGSTLQFSLLLKQKVRQLLDSVLGATCSEASFPCDCGCERVVVSAGWPAGYGVRTSDWT
ncbi:hypothetical protein Bbelb_080360 [Branchiostoma belcheri]|nr:hypothetical protein Bbelb_080360 [Branchiostoma belcheri]